MTHDDRREFQRLRLTKPILAGMDRGQALILDIGMAGAFLEHYGRVSSGDRFDLTFRWLGADVRFDCEVVRSTVVRDPAGDAKSVVSHTGVHFIEAVGDSQSHLQEMMAMSVGRILAAQKANAAGTRERSAGESVLARLGEARRKRSKGFVSYRFKDNSWWRVPTKSASQPEDGFTVAAWEDENEVAILCETYEIANEEARSLIRLVAELSAMSEDG